MNNTGMNMNGGPMFKGKFTNMKDGSEVFVRDTIIAEEGMVVILDNGEMIPINTFNNEYFQMSDDVYDIKGNKIGKAENKTNIGKKSDSLNADLIFAGLNNTASSELSAIKTNEPTHSIVPEGQAMVSKLLKKVDKPEILIELKWDSFPKKQIEMLKEFYDVSDEEIIEAIINEYFKSTFIKDECVSQLSNFLKEK